MGSPATTDAPAAGTAPGDLDRGADDPALIVAWVADPRFLAHLAEALAAPRNAPAVAFAVAALRLDPPAADPVVDVLAALRPPHPALRVAGEFFPDRRASDACRQRALAGLLPAWIALLGGDDAVDVLRAIGIALQSSLAVRQVFHAQDGFARVVDAIQSTTRSPSAVDAICREVFLVALGRCGAGVRPASIGEIAAGAITSVLAIPVLVDLLPAASRAAQAQAFALLGACLSPPDHRRNLALVASACPSITERLLVEFGAVLCRPSSSSSDERRPALASLLALLLRHRPSAAAVNRLLHLAGVDDDQRPDGAGRLLDYVVQRLLLPGADVPYVQFDLSGAGVAALASHVIGRTWPPPKGYSIALWFTIDAVDDRDTLLRLVSLPGALDLYLERAHLHLRLPSGDDVVFGEFDWMPGPWYHLVVTHERRLIQSSLLTAYVNGEALQTVKLAYPAAAAAAQGGADDRLPLLVGDGPGQQQQQQRATRWKATSLTIASTSVPAAGVAAWFAAGRQATLVAGASVVRDEVAPYLASCAAIDLALADGHPDVVGVERATSSHARSLSTTMTTTTTADDGRAGQCVPASATLAAVHAQHSRCLLYASPVADSTWVVSAASPGGPVDDAQTLGDAFVFAPTGLAASLSTAGGVDQILPLLAQATTTEALNQVLLLLAVLLRDSPDCVRDLVRGALHALVAHLLRRAAPIWDAATVDLLLALAGLSQGGRRGRIVNLWALEAFLMDMHVWQGAPVPVQKRVLQALHDAVVENAARAHNQAALWPVNPVGRLLTALGDDDLSADVTPAMTHLLGVFIAVSPSADHFAMACDSAVAAVQVYYRRTSSSTNSSRRAPALQRAAHSFDESRMASAPAAAPSSSSSSSSPVQLRAHSAWALGRRHRLLELLLHLVRRAFETGDAERLALFCESVDACFVCTLVEGGGNPQRRTTEIALQLLSLFVAAVDGAGERFARADLFRVLPRLMEPFAHCPEVHALLVLMLAARPYYAAWPDHPSLAGASSIADLTRRALALPADPRHLPFPAAATVLIALVVHAGQAVHARRDDDDGGGDRQAGRRSVRPGSRYSTIGDPAAVATTMAITRPASVGVAAARRVSAMTPRTAGGGGSGAPSAPTSPKARTTTTRAPAAFTFDVPPSAAADSDATTITLRLDGSDDDDDECQVVVEDGTLDDLDDDDGGDDDDLQDKVTPSDPSTMSKTMSPSSEPLQKDKVHQRQTSGGTGSRPVAQRVPASGRAFPGVPMLDEAYLCDSVQALIDVVGSVDSPSVTFARVFDPAVIRQVAAAVFALRRSAADAAAAFHTALSRQFETLLVSLLVQTMIDGRHEPCAQVRTALDVSPPGTADAVLNAFQSSLVRALTDRLCRLFAARAGALMQASAVRHSLIAFVRLVGERVHAGLYVYDHLELAAQLFTLNARIGGDGPSSSERPRAARAILACCRKVFLFLLCRRDAASLEDKVLLHSLMLENAHLLFDSGAGDDDNSEFARCVLYHAGLHLLSGSATLRALGLRQWRWLLTYNFALAESILVWQTLDVQAIADPQAGLSAQMNNLLTNRFDRLLSDDDSDFLGWLERPSHRELVAAMLAEQLKPVWVGVERARQRECLSQRTRRSSSIADQMQAFAARLAVDSTAEAEMEFAILHQLNKVRDREVLRLLTARQNVDEMERTNQSRWDLHQEHTRKVRAIQALSWPEPARARLASPSVTWSSAWTLDLTEGPLRIRSKLQRVYEIALGSAARPSLESPRPQPIAPHRSSSSSSRWSAIASPSALAPGLGTPSRRRSRRPTNRRHSRSTRLSNMSLSALVGASHPPATSVSDVDDDDAGGADSDVLDDWWARGEQRLRILLEPDADVQAFYPCKRVVGLDETDSILVLCTGSITLIVGYRISDQGDVIQATPTHKKQSRQRREWAASAAHDQHHLGVVHDPVAVVEDDESAPAPIRFPFDQISRLSKCRYLLQPSALDISLTDGSNFLLVFALADRKDAYDLMIASCPRLMDPDATATLFNSEASQVRKLIRSLTTDWVAGSICNFDYLLHLSLLSHRTFNDLTQYPVFPWVLQDYQSGALDLDDPVVFRDLSRPIGALDPDRAAMFQERFASWDDDSIPRFHYGTHYSSAPVVLSFLVRLEPFTTQFRSLHGGRFDRPDRMFHDVGESWRMCSGANAGTSDVRELLPEFYFLPEFLENGNDLDLGVRANGQPTGAVVLPPWAHGSAREFVRRHRQALESDHVSANLHHWIDLIYGYKQRGPAAVDACNVFYYTSYEGQVDFQDLDDPVRKSALIEQVRSFGQTPGQLWTKAHPARAARADTGRIVSDADLLRTQEFIQAGGPVGAIASRHGKTVVAALQATLIGPAFDQCATWSTADGTIRLYAVGADVGSVQAPGDARLAFKGVHAPGSLVTCVSVSTDGTCLVSGASDSSIGVFKRGVCEAWWVLCGRLDGHLASIVGLAVSTEFSILVSASADGVVLVWDLNRLEPVGTLPMGAAPHPAPTLVTVDATGNGDIAVGVGSLHMGVWDRNCKRVAALVSEHSRASTITSLRFASTLATVGLLTGHLGGAVCQWVLGAAPDDAQLQCARVFPFHTCAVTAIQVGGDVNQFWTGDVQGHVVQWGVSVSALTEQTLAAAAQAGLDAPAHQPCALCARRFRSLADPRQFCARCKALFCQACWLEHYRQREQHRLRTVGRGRAPTSAPSPAETRGASREAPVNARDDDVDPDAPR